MAVFFFIGFFTVFIAQPYSDGGCTQCVCIFTNPIPMLNVTASDSVIASVRADIYIVFITKLFAYRASSSVLT